MRRQLVLAAGTAATALALGTAASASAATTVDTTTTFTVSGGGLAITAPATKALGTGAAADTIGGQMGDVTVTDSRAALGGTWTGSVSSSDFTNTTVTGAAVIAKANLSYWSGPATASTGTAVTTPGQANAGAAVTLATPRTAYSASATTGNNSTTWQPTLSLALPAQAIAGNYTGTITHSVA